MTVIPFRAPHGLTPAEVAELVVFANKTDIGIETGATEDKWSYVALDFGPCFEMAAGEAVWVVSWEHGKVVAYDEEDGALLAFKTVADALTAFRRLLPTKHSRFG